MVQKCAYQHILALNNTWISVWHIYQSLAFQCYRPWSFRVTCLEVSELHALKFQSHMPWSFRVTGFGISELQALDYSGRRATFILRTVRFNSTIRGQGSYLWLISCPLCDTWAAERTLLNYIIIKQHPQEPINQLVTHTHTHTHTYTHTNTHMQTRKHVHTHKQTIYIQTVFFLACFLYCKGGNLYCTRVLPLYLFNVFFFYVDFFSCTCISFICLSVFFVEYMSLWFSL